MTKVWPEKVFNVTRVNTDDSLIETDEQASTVFLDINNTRALDKMAKFYRPLQHIDKKALKTGDIKYVEISNSLPADVDQES